MIAASPHPRQRTRRTAGAFRELAHTERRYPGARIDRHCGRTPVEADLTEQDAVPLIVLSSAREPVEAVNSILRRAGQPAHCTWIPALRDLGDALTLRDPRAR
jgi:hypothetical protein